MDLAEFDGLFDKFRQRAFRLETLPHYEMGDEQGSFAAYLSGKPLPPPEATASWVEFLQAARREGKSVQLVRILPSSPTPYIRFEIDWGYLYYSEAGEDIRVLVSDTPSEVFGQLPHGDFWLFDDSVVAEMIYSKDGRFLEPRKVAETSAVSSFVEAARLAWSKAVPLSEYLASFRRA